MLLDTSDFSRDMPEELNFFSGPKDRPEATFVDRTEQGRARSAIWAGGVAHVVNGLRHRITVICARWRWLFSRSGSGMRAVCHAVTAGQLEGSAGWHEGRRAEVMMQEVVASTVTITLLEVPVRAIGLGDGFVIRAGCDKRLETCRDRFANVLNFRSFPNIPGQDAVLRYAAKGDANQGVVL